MGRSNGNRKGMSEEVIRQAIERSGSDLTDELVKMLAKMPKSQIVRILNGEGIDGVSLDDVESLRKIAKVVGAESRGLKYGRI